jgi:hypothetical protein
MTLNIRGLCLERSSAVKDPGEWIRERDDGSVKRALPYRVSSVVHETEIQAISKQAERRSAAGVKRIDVIGERLFRG